MLLTVTLSPSIDKLYVMDKMTPETVMRVKQVNNTPGGKGLNVSRVAAALGEKVTAMGFIGGFNGAYLESMLRTSGVNPRFTNIQGETRSCINLWDLSRGRSTEYLEPGTPVTSAESARFMQEFAEELKSADVVTISGSIPSGAPSDIYQQLIAMCHEAKVPVMLDTSGATLAAAAKACPTLMKPNMDEIAQLLGHPVVSEQDVVSAARALQSSGVPYVVVSMGASGAVLAAPGVTLRGIPPKITPVNTVGCGDSMLAAMAVGFLRHLPISDTFRLSLAVSAASALSLSTGSFSSSDQADIAQAIAITEV